MILTLTIGYFVVGGIYAQWRNAWEAGEDVANVLIWPAAAATLAGRTLYSTAKDAIARLRKRT